MEVVLTIIIILQIKGLHHVDGFNEIKQLPFSKLLIFSKLSSSSDNSSVFVFTFSNGDVFTNILNGATNILLISFLNSKIKNTSNFMLKYIACETMITISI